ncbi:hypothetical protein JKF63_03461 [Porcisia hertigi]|uniref:Uncharacterized protein n=1 Tax=Porcisia hertigi TaxID=2761500 RepID=A0A836HWB2_9TRYP|nr:hypothetical protein JKF63_03461 [Porcisia hertigi]
MASSSKKKSVFKERLSTEAPSGTASFQSPFVSAAHNTVWPYDSALQKKSEPTIFTAAANVVCGRLNGAYSRDDAGARAQPVVHDQALGCVLPESNKWESARAIYDRLDTATLSLENGPSLQGFFLPSYDLPRGCNKLYAEWLSHISANRGSPLQYPHHVIHMTTPLITSGAFASSGSNQQHAVWQIATVLHRLLASHIRRCNEQPRTPEREADGRVPWRVFTTLLGSSVYNRNFDGPPVERKDVTFGWEEPPAQTSSSATEPKVDSDGATATGPASASQVKAHGESAQAPQPFVPPRRHDDLSVFSRVDAAHINVCVGQEFYKLCVIDRRRGHLRSVASLAADLEVLYTHYLSLDKTDVAPGVSPVVQQDRKDLKMMFANLSSLADEVAFDVRRRLRVSSEVNAYSLDALEAGLCTLVLREDSAPRGIECADCPTMPVAQWLHSVCCLETSLSHPEQWTMRLQALVVSLQAGMDWVRSAFAQPSDGAATEPTTIELVTPDVGDSARGVTQQGAPVLKGIAGSHELSTMVDARGNVEHLELWLPEKHRIPLRPYAAPVWNRADTQHSLSDVFSDACTLEDFCISLLRLTAQWKRQNQPPFSRAAVDEWPRIVIVVQPPRGGAPSLVALDMPAVKHFYEVLAAPPMLFAVESRRLIEAQARAQVAAVLNVIWHTTSPVRTSLKDESKACWWFDGSTTTTSEPSRCVDVVLSFAVMSRQPLPSLNSGARTIVMSRFLSDFGLSSRLAVNCTAQQVAAEAHVCASESTLVDAVVSANTPAAAPHVCKFGASLASCMREPH